MPRPWRAGKQCTESRRLTSGSVGPATSASAREVSGPRRRLAGTDRNGPRLGCPALGHTDGQDAVLGVRLGGIKVDICGSGWGHPLSGGDGVSHFLGSGRGCPLSDTWEKWMAPNLCFRSLVRRVEHESAPRPRAIHERCPRGETFPSRRRFARDARGKPANSGRGGGEDRSRRPAGSSPGGDS